MTFASTVFQLNRSKATILPKDLNIPLGSKLFFTPQKPSQFILQVTEPKIPQETPEEMIRHLAGKFRGGKIDLSPSEMKRLYDQDVYKI